MIVHLASSASVTPAKGVTQELLGLVFVFRIRKRAVVMTMILDSNQGLELVSKKGLLTLAGGRKTKSAHDEKT